MPGDQVAGSWLQSMIIPYALIGLVFWFFVIKPSKDKERGRQERLKGLQKNDSVITSAGIHGTVVLVKDKTAVVRVDDNVKIEFDKEAITHIVSAKG